MAGTALHRATPAQREAEVLAYWKAHDPFTRTLTRPALRDFVFYEGPPTANGRPHVAHVIPRALKDLFTRYRTMLGERVLRKAGWDTHGLPVELEVEKELGLSGKPQVEAYGVAEFTRRCRESVWRFQAEWERNATERLGYWLDLEHPYVTYDERYVESVWWAMAQFWQKGLVYHGHKVVPYCPRCGTGLSSHEVAQGYAEVEDPALTVRFPVLSPGPLQGASLLAWTTTPWTLPANLALAVRPDATYALAEVEGERVVALAERLPPGARPLSRFPGADLVGLRYEPPFRFAPAAEYRVLGAPWVLVEEGTGVVHIAPAFGEDDARLGQEHGLPVFRPVDDQGRYTAQVPPWEGLFVKDADPRVTEALRAAGRLFHAGKVHHTYPFCWRCDTPLLYMARGAWFVRTTAYKEQLLAANAQVQWHPEHFREGRFGHFLENLVDWCVSRERYWGTPLPLWRCDCGHAHMVGSVAELEGLAGRRVTDLHRPAVDEVTFPCPACGGLMRRTPEVLDCWFDSGCMPFAQHHYPFENADLFRQQFPADFICEAVDQTRGWFYVMLAVCVGLFGQAPYRRVLVTELGLDERGKKMSKSRRNVVDLAEVLDQYGADALRLYVYTSGQPWLPKRLSRQGVAEAGRVLDTLQNLLSFQLLYARLAGWEPTGLPGPERLSSLDRWLLSRLQGVTRSVGEGLAGYDVTGPARELCTWVDDLSNWYVRLSRRRFWEGEEAALAVLHHALRQTALLLAPFTPFLAEALHLKLGGGESVHLGRFPEADPSLADGELERRMALVRRYASAGRAARQAAGLKVRQPLASVLLLGGEEPGDLTPLLMQELNVKAVAAWPSAEAPEGYVPGEDGPCRVAVDTRLTPELVREGLVREVVNRLQRHRKEQGLAVEDRVRLWLDGSPALLAALEAHREYLVEEVQAAELQLGPADHPQRAPLEATLDTEWLRAWVERA
ncbi:MAG: isoleucine--tRNA ligase [Bacillota bacterium]